MYYSRLLKNFLGVSSLRENSKEFGIIVVISTVICYHWTKFRFFGACLGDFFSSLYSSVYSVVHFHAGKMGIHGQAREELPRPGSS